MKTDVMNNMTKYTKIVTLVFFILFCMFSYIAHTYNLSKSEYVTFTTELFFLYCVMLLIETDFRNKGDK